MSNESVIHTGPDGPRNPGPVSGPVDWGLPYQPVNRETRPPYIVDPYQYSPVDYGVNSGTLGTDRTGADTWNGRDRFNIQNYYDQLLPTSINIRNRGLQDIFQRMQTPMMQLYAGQGVDKAARERGAARDQLTAGAAARGLGNSGQLAQLLRENEMGYLGNVSNAESAGNDAEVKRKAGLYNQILGSNQSDIDFYKYINAGRDVAVGRVGGVNIASLAGIGRGAAGLGAWLAGDKNPNTVDYGGGAEGADIYKGGLNDVYSNSSGGSEDIYGTPAQSGGGWFS